jgi:hypothetical protein
MAATNASIETCDSEVDPSRADDPHPAGLDLLCASLEHLYACYRMLVDNSAVTPAPARRPAAHAPRSTAARLGQML